MKRLLLCMLVTLNVQILGLNIGQQYHLHFWAQYNQAQDNKPVAQRCYTLLLQHSSSPYLYPNFLEFLFQTGQHPLVVQLTPVVERFISLDLRSRFIFAQSLHHLGLTREALHHLESLSKENPNHGEIIYATAQLYLVSNNIPAALSLIEIHLKNNPSREHFLAFNFLKAQAFIFQQKYDAAKTILKTVLEIHPHCDKVWLLMGVVHELDGDPKSAIEHYQHYLKLAGSNKIIEEQLSRLKSKIK